MRQVEPKVYVWAQTMMHPEFREFLSDIGIPDWFANSDAESVGDILIEAAGRLCYRSWIPWDESRPEASNPNLSRVREGNAAYVGNLLKQGHGSVFEHINVSVLFRDVSRVFTHELVRHRAGMGYSQESLRFVRAHNLGIWIPPSVQGMPGDVAGVFTNLVSRIEEFAAAFAAKVGLDDATDFRVKKTLTSLVRRLLPQGMATNILATGNLRAWRHVLCMRGDKPSVEEEMLVVMDQLGPKLKAMYPAAFSDVTRTDDGWRMANRKV